MGLRGGRKEDRIFIYVATFFLLSVTFFNFYSFCPLSSVLCLRHFPKSPHSQHPKQTTHLCGMGQAMIGIIWHFRIIRVMTYQGI